MPLERTGEVISDSAKKQNSILRGDICRVFQPISIKEFLEFGFSSLYNKWESQCRNFFYFLGDQNFLF